MCKIDQLSNSVNIVRVVLTLMLFKSQQISFMFTLLSKVIHPRLTNLHKKTHRSGYYIGFL